MINRSRIPVLAAAAALMATAAMAVAAVPASSQDPETEASEADERLAELQQRLDDARERLQLTDEQVEQLVPIWLESFEGTATVLEEHGINLMSLAEGSESRPSLNLRQLRALSRDLDEVREAMYEKIEELGILSEEQFDEFKKIQQEQREAMRERLRARRGLS